MSKKSGHARGPLRAVLLSLMGLALASPAAAQWAQSPDGSDPGDVQVIRGAAAAIAPSTHLTEVEMTEVKLHSVTVCHYDSESL